MMISLCSLLQDIVVPHQAMLHVASLHKPSGSTFQLMTVEADLHALSRIPLTLRFTTATLHPQQAIVKNVLQCTKRKQQTQSFDRNFPRTLESMSEFHSAPPSPVAHSMPNKDENRSFPLMRLPLEIRLETYSYALAAPNGVVLR